jgi:hypothetical protein
VAGELAIPAVVVVAASTWLVPLVRLVGIVPLPWVTTQTRNATVARILSAKVWFFSSHRGHSQPSRRATVSRK